MKVSKSRWLAAAFAFLLIPGLVTAQPVDQDKSKDKSKDKPKSSGKAPPGQSPYRKPDSGSQYPPGKGPTSGRPGDSSGNSTSRSSDQTTRPREDKTPNTDSSKKSNDKARQPSDGSKNTTESTKQTGDRTRQPSERINQPDDHAKQPGNRTPAPQPKLETRQIPNGEEKRTASGQVRERLEKKSDGEHTQYIAPTGRVQKEVVQKPDGTQHTKQYAPDGKVQREVIASKDGSKETVQMRYDRNGKERATETVKVDARGREVSKTVVVKQTTVIVKNTTIVHNTTIVRNYDRARFGFAYHPVYVVRSPVFVSWYDPYWYAPSGVLIVHPFRYSWGWEDYGWYRCHHHYWATYDVYPAPCYWVTDWLIAGYVADRYAASVSAEQAREEARLAREDADRARLTAEKAREDAELAEARAAQGEAEARAAKAEARIAKAEAEEARAKTLAGQPSPNATPIDPQTKEALRTQIESAIAEKKAFAEESAKGKKPVVPDLSKALADPKHIYPVSSPINVISAADQNPAGTLTEGDLLRLEPGQENILKDADENTLVAMRVVTSKGEEGEAKAGTVVSISLKSLQDFDSEFRAKLDLGLAEADKNKDQFKKAL